MSRFLAALLAFAVLAWSAAAPNRTGNPVQSKPDTAAAPSSRAKGMCQLPSDNTGIKAAMSA